ncbi:hypothetical protein X769_32575 [Mesorhizobium sp. LSJC268A00]|nr:hypothetical protein X769_32575 [Mesorhizobium sp. LSJC268A00]
MDDADKVGAEDGERHKARPQHQLRVGMHIFDPVIKQPSSGRESRAKPSRRNDNTPSMIMAVAMPRVVETGIGDRTASVFDRVRTCGPVNCTL